MAKVTKSRGRVVAQVMGVGDVVGPNPRVPAIALRMVGHAAVCHGVGVLGQPIGCIEIVESAVIGKRGEIEFSE